jgi:hypothetical protein
MAEKYWKLEKSGELSAEQAAAAVGIGGHTVLRTDVAKGKTTIYFAGGATKDEHAKKVRSAATEVKLADVTR